MIVRRKFSIPEPPVSGIPRPELLARLRAGLDPRVRLTVLRAGAGAGKTALLASYLPALSAEDPSVPAGWYTAGKPDRDPTRLLAHIHGALATVFPDLPRQAEQILAASGAGGLAQALGILCDDLADLAQERPFVFVIDDAHHLAGDPAIAEGLDALAQYFPDEGQLVLAGRELPELKLGRYQLERRIVALDADLLAFSPAECRLALALAGDDPGQEAADRLHARTKGWPAGVCLGAGPADGEDTLYAYLQEEVLRDLPPQLQEDLHVCAFLDDLAAETCEALFGERATALRTELERRPLLITRAGPDRERGLVPVIRDSLAQAVLERWSPADRQDLFRRLAMAAGDLAKAVRFLARAGDWSDAEALLVAEVPDLLTSRQLATLLDVAATFPVERLARSAGLQYALGEAARLEGRLNEALSHLATADRLAAADEDGKLRGAVWTSLAACHGARGETALQEDFARRALAVLPETSTAEIGACWNALGMAHVFRDEIADGEKALGEALRRFRDAGLAPGQIRVRHNLGLALARAGDFRQAAEHYREALELAKAYGEAPLAITYRNLALCEIYLGRFREAEGPLAEGMAIAERTGKDADRGPMLRTVARWHLETGSPAQARRHFRRGIEVGAAVGDRLGQVQGYLGLAETALREGTASEAEEALGRARDLAGTSLGAAIAPEVMLLQTEIALAQGRTAEAADRFREALAELGDGRKALLRFQAAKLGLRLAQAGGDAPQAERHARDRDDLARNFGFPLTGEPAAGLGKEEPRSATLEVQALGPFVSRIEGAEVVGKRWVSQRAKLALAYLLSRPEGATKEDLEEVLFQRGGTGKTAANMVFSRLRRTLEPEASPGAPSRFILFQGGRYLFNPGIPVRYDVAEFRDRLRERRIEEAIVLYRGPFLVEFEDSDWCEVEREALRRELRAAYETLFAQAAREDDWPRLERAADGLLAREPLSQEAHRARILALAMQERREESAQACRSIEDLLDRSHLEADPETAELVQLVRTDRLTIRAARALLPARW